MSLLEPYLLTAEGDRYDAIALFARDLMRGNVRQLQQGYTFANALYAACEVDAGLGADIQPMRVTIVAERLHNLLAEEAGGA